MTDKRPNGGNGGFQYIQPRRKIPKLDVSIVSGSQQAAGTSSTASTAASSASRRSAFPPPIVRTVTHPNRAPSTSSAANQYRPMMPPMHRPPPPAAQQHQPPLAPAPPPASEDMWGDEDEDFIMLASQVAENVEACGQTILVDSMDVSFGDFRRHRQMSASSTQKPDGPATSGLGHRPPAPMAAAQVTAAAAAANPYVDDNDDDDVFSELPDFDQIDDVNKHINEYLNNEQNTLAQQNYSTDGSSSASGGGGDPLAAAGQPQPAAQSTAAEVPVAAATNNYMQNVENAREVRLRFIGQQLAEKQTEADRLQLEVTKLNEKCQTKDGEIAMIRYDLQQNRKVQTDLRQDKRVEAERIKAEYGSKLAELERVNQGQQSEMDFLRLEILNLKSRRTHDSNLNASHKPANVPQPFDPNGPAPSSRSPPMPDSALCNLFRLHFIRPPQATATAAAIPLHIPPIESSPMPAIRQHRPPNSLLEQLGHLQRLAASLIDCPRPQSATISAQILRTTARGMQIIGRDCSALATTASRGAESTTTATTTATAVIVYDCEERAVQLAHHRLLVAGSLSAAGELYANESQRAGRRLVACLAAICRRSWRICEGLLVAEGGGSQSQLQQLTRSLQLIAMSTRWKQYLGLVEASAELLAAYVGHDWPQRAGRAEWVEQLQQLLHAVLCCRPAASSLGHIVHFLRRADTIAAGSAVLATICRRSKEFALVCDAPRRVQFSCTACSMQLLAALLQTDEAFSCWCEAQPQRGRMLLLDVTLDVLRLMQAGEDRPLRWMWRTTEVDDVGERQQQQQQMVSVNGGGRTRDATVDDLCLCYAQLVCAGVRLVHACLKRWIERPRTFDLKTIIAIAQAASLFISDHFTMRYEGLILRVGGPAIKQRLHVAFAWLHQYQTVFLFERVHQQALANANHLRGVRHMFELLNSAASVAEPVNAASAAAAASIWSSCLQRVRDLREAPERDERATGEATSDTDEEPDY